jgi:hypothetical protein
MPPNPAIRANPHAELRIVIQRVQISDMQVYENAVGF